MLRDPRFALLLAAPLALGLSGCDAARPVAATAASCTRCHGDPATGNAAPPRSVSGATASANITVGAHQAHMQGGASRGPVACGECHLVPDRVDSPGHMDGVVEVTFGPLASADGTQPSWDPAAGTCASTYCHGGTMIGGKSTAPSWSATGSLGCDACHGLPPPNVAHTTVAADPKACAGCHGGTVRADGTIDLAGGKHMNGIIEGPNGSGCNACHGDPARAPAAIAAAPPRDTKGNSATTAPGVGAHQAHLAGGALRGPLACADCHRVPATMAHAAQPLDLTWSALATGGVAGGATFDPAALSCANYCHGATLSGGTKKAPVWTKGSAEAACGTCHGLPPGNGHPSVSGGAPACNRCHPQTVKPDGTIDLAGGTHLNGSVEAANLTCTSCHGGTLSGGTGKSGANPVAAAPPTGTKGETATSTRAVGMHAQHLTSTKLSTSMMCSQCHAVPTTTGHPNGTALVTFSGMANQGNSGAIFGGTTCASTYCHGKFTGGASATVAWANAAVPVLTCTSCHGTPPSTGHHGTHSGGEATCANCHGSGYSASLVNAALHVNGVKNVGGSGSQIASWNAGTGSCQPASNQGCHGSKTW